VAAFQLLRQIRKNCCFQEHPANPGLYLAMGRRKCRFVEDAYRVLAILLDAQSELPVLRLDLSLLTADQVEEDHRLCPIPFVCGGTGSLPETTLFSPTEIQY
jgi:hypothetical protein